jgi:photosystem II reaction center protein PsbP
MTKPSVFVILASLSLVLMAPIFDVSVFASVDPNAYVNSNNQFSINPPSGWTVDSSGAYGTTVVFYGPTDTSFRINMNVVVESTSLTLSAYVSASKTQLYATLTSYNIVSEGAKTIGGIDGYELVGTFTQGSFNIENKQDFLVQNQKAYVITSTALQSNYNTYQPGFEESVQTFKLTAPQFPWLIVIALVVIVGGAAVGLTIFLVRRKGRVEVPPAMPPSYPPPQPAPTP